MAMVLFIVRFMELVWTLYVLGGGSGEVRVGWGIRWVWGVRRFGWWMCNIRMGTGIELAQVTI